MKLSRVGFVGWRGMVGSVLLQRMLEQNDFSLIEEPVFYSTSQIGQEGPVIGYPVPPLQDARNLRSLITMDVIVTCQGGNYTKEIHSALRKKGWMGYWLDAASALRMKNDTIIVLDPVNMPIIERGLLDKKKDFVVGNCTVGLMLMALNGLFNNDLVDWVTVATYQAISGAGARQMRELIKQMGVVYNRTSNLLNKPSTSILDIDQSVIQTMRSEKLPNNEIGFPLAGNLLPWIDLDLENGMSREEWKGPAETNKILGREDRPISVESICVRIGTMRCHSQALTIKLKHDLPLDEISEIMSQANKWVRIVDNERTATLHQLTPAAVTGTLDIPIGRLRKSAIGGEYITAFTVGDQLLWGAAEPLRRMLRILHTF